MPHKPLSPDDSVLWARVVADVKPVRGRSNEAGALPVQRLPKHICRAEVESLLKADGLPSPKPSVTKKTNLLHSPRYGAARPPVSPTPPHAQNTLDARWDKRLIRGDIRPDCVIDLHEHSAAAAHVRLAQGLADAISQGARIVLLITGKARGPDNPRLPPTTRGVIRASVQDWIAGSAYNRSIAAIRNAHPRHGGAGALYLIMRRAR